MPSSLAMAGATGPGRMPRVLSLDMDGTLCTDANAVSPATVEALRQFASRPGHHVLIATGRSAGEATDVVDAYLPGIVTCCIVMDGGAVLAPPRWNLVHRTGGMSGLTASRLWTASVAALSDGLLHCGAQLYSGYGTAMVSSERYIELVEASDPGMGADIRRNPEPVVPAICTFGDALAARDQAAPAGLGFLRFLLSTDGGGGIGGGDHESGAASAQDKLLALLEPIVHTENAAHNSGITIRRSIVAGGVIISSQFADKSVSCLHLMPGLSTAAAAAAAAAVRPG
jgi:hypothetical protein